MTLVTPVLGYLQRARVWSKILRPIVGSRDLHIGWERYHLEAAYTQVFARSPLLKATVTIFACNYRLGPVLSAVSVERRRCSYRIRREYQSSGSEDRATLTKRQV